MRWKQDRSRRSGHKQSLNTQDYALRALSIEERALFYFRQWVAMRPQLGYYDVLPDDCKRVVDEVGKCGR